MRTRVSSLRPARLNTIPTRRFEYGQRLALTEVALGQMTFAFGQVTFAFGQVAFGFGQVAFAFGQMTFAFGQIAFALGQVTVALGQISTLPSRPGLRVRRGNLLPLNAFGPRGRVRCRGLREAFRCRRGQAAPATSRGGETPR